MGIKLKSFLFVLDRNPVYRPGEVVQGSCVINLEGQMDLGQLHIKLEGLANNRWSESYTTSHTSNGRTTTQHHTRTITSSATHLDLCYRPGDAYPGVLNGGEHRIEFTFQLPPMLPSSFEGQFGNIRYHLRATIHTPLFNFDKRNDIVITMRSPAYLPIQQLTQGVKNSNTKTVGFFSSKTVTINCHLQRIGHNIGTVIPIMCVVENNSTKSMILRATLKEFVTFTAQGRTKYTKNKVSLVQGSTIAPKSNQTEMLSLPVPPTAPVTLNICPIIQIHYMIIVTLDIPSAIDLHCELPVTITEENLPEVC